MTARPYSTVAKKRCGSNTLANLARAVREHVPAKCLARKCGRGGCSVRLADAPTEHAAVDLDCPALPQPDGKRCDFVFVGEEPKGDSAAAWVAPIELKSGAFSAGAVAEQLQAGADLADQWLPADASFKFVPVVAHGRGIRREKLKALQKTSVTLRGQLRGQERRPKLLRCGSPLRQALVG